MNSRNITIAAAAVTLSAGAFIAGRFSAPGSESSASASTQDTAPSRMADRSSRDSEQAAATRESSARTSRERVKKETAQAGMQRIALITDPTERTQAWLDFVNTLDPAEFESAVASFRDEGYTREHMSEYSILLSAWAKKDPLAALDYAKANTGNRFARNTILTTWAASDPQGAISWAKQNHEGEGANPWMIGVIRGMASTDPAGASRLLGDMPFSEERGEAMMALVPHMLSQGGDAARTWAEGITDERLRDGAISQVAEGLARKDPATAAAWLASTPGNAAARVMDDVVATWYRKDRAEATSYFEGLTAGDARTNALRGIANTMAQEDPRAAATFIDSHKADANDNTYQQFVWSSFGAAPDLAVQYISKIGDERNRNGMYNRMLDGWLRRDYAAASAWIGSNNLPANVRERVNRQMNEMQQRQQ